MSANNRRKSVRKGIKYVGAISEQITGMKLPSSRQVLSRFFYLHTNEKRTVSDSASVTAKEVIEFWEKAHIPTQQLNHVKEKVQKLFVQRQKLQKNCSRQCTNQQSKEKSFTDKLDELFDVAHKKAFTLIKNPEDLAFLKAQREKGRPGSMTSVDMVSVKKMKRKQEADLKEQQRIEKEKKRRCVEQTEVETNIHRSSSESALSSESLNSFEDPSTPSTGRYYIKRRQRFINPELTSALDRSKVSDRRAVFVVASTARAMGHSLSNLSVSRQSIRRQRRTNRKKIAEELKRSFSASVPLTVHWDGKILPDLTNERNVDRIAVIVSGGGIDKLLGVPKIDQGTGALQAEAIFQCLEEWNVADRIKCMCFDTTASNTGDKKGTCVRLEGKLKRNLLSFACRHHIFELVVSAVFDSLLGPSSGPDITIFKRFSKSWEKIDTTKFESAVMDESFSTLSLKKNDMVEFIKLQLLSKQPRDDYKELLQLSLLFLGYTNEQFPIRRPGALHRARWMAKIIYSLKIYLFRSQFSLSAKERRGITNFNIFIVSLYVKIWYRAPCPTSAPRLDLEFIKQLKSYETINSIVSKAAIGRFKNHLWYLSEELISLAFFDDDVSCNVKKEMVKKLREKSGKNPAKKLVFTEEIFTKDLSDFVTGNSLGFFKKLDIETDGFLSVDPELWDENEAYLNAKEQVRSLRIVNDVAERGIALIQSYNKILTTQENQQQYLLQVIERHRKKFPDVNKATICN